MKSKATHAFSVMQGDTCHSTIPNRLLVFFCQTILIHRTRPTAAQAYNFYIPCNGVASSSCLFNSRAHTFAGAQACKWMVPKWGQSYLGFRELTDEPLRVAH